MVSLDYVWEKFNAAVTSLAESTDTLQGRLADVYFSQLIRLSPDDLPADMRDDFKLLIHELTKISPTDNECCIDASAAKLGEQTACDLIERVVNLYGLVCRRLGPDEDAELG